MLTTDKVGVEGYVTRFTTSETGYVVGVMRLLIDMTD